MKTLQPRTLGNWRRWLAQHHDSETEVWVIFHKRHTGTSGLVYEEAVEEALCYGWVDSLVRRLDDERYARKFTPRRSDSRWSPLNRKRYEALKASGRLQQPGIDRPPTSRGYPLRPPRYELPGTLPEYIDEALKQRPAAKRRFDALSPSHRREYIGWIETAKREETRLRRLKEVIRVLAAGTPLGLK